MRVGKVGPHDAYGPKRTFVKEPTMANHMTVLLTAAAAAIISLILVISHKARR